MSESPKTASIAIEKMDGAVIVRPQLKMMDENALKALAGAIDESSSSDTGITLVILDLSRVAIVPSLALGSLVQVANKCRARQQKLKLAAVQPQIRQVFTITRLDRVFQFADSVEAAMQ
jgi:anti-sigma B factor antagonist